MTKSEKDMGKEMREIDRVIGRVRVRERETETDMGK